MRRFLLFGLLVSAFSVVDDKSLAAERPNVVWILSEDNSIHYLRLYGAPLGVTPAIEDLAAQGITFNHAFSCAPVCSVARTTLMTGCYAPRVGFQYHRKTSVAKLPGGGKMFPAYLRDAGYYTTNRSKKDYNVVEGKVWDASSGKASWRNRPTSTTPFFHMQTTTLSHESSLHFRRAQINYDSLTTNPEDIKLADYHPDTPLFRYTYARYHDRMRAVDENVADIIGKLKEDNLLDDTFIFYFGDHGGVLPRSKGYVYESGLHVPLVVYTPKNWKHLAPWTAGNRTDGFVQFIDFGPTVLNIAGVKVPETMDGKAFLGKGVDRAEIDARDEAFGHADRFDEKYDVCRSLRKGRFKYIRNYHSFYPDGLQNNYRYIMLAYSEWRDMYRMGKLNNVQAQFFQPRPAEALYDVEADPHEVNNLGNDPKYRDVLLQLRTRLQQIVKDLPDLSFYPESFLVDEILPAGAEYGQQHRKQISRLVDVADLAVLDFPAARHQLQQSLQSSDRWERYWAVVACSCFGKRAAPLAAEIRKLSDDTEHLVQLRAAEFLAIVTGEDPRPALRRILSETTSPVVAAIALNSAVFLQDRSPSFQLNVAEIKVNATNDQVKRRMLYLAGKTKPGVNVNPRKRKKKPN
ncbi:MAG TPA: DUF229 domain-containing protein [Planctomycetes bacterium]|nr:DUF229 domain-containing protein [Planctomycetota bacterium]